MSTRTLTLANDTRACSYCRDLAHAPYILTTKGAVPRTVRLCPGHASAAARRYGLVLTVVDLLPFRHAAAPGPRP